MPKKTLAAVMCLRAALTKRFSVPIYLSGPKDKFLNFLKAVTCAKYDGIRQLHDSIANLPSRWLKRARVPHKGGAWGNTQTCKENFSKQINRLSNNNSDNDRWLQRVIPGLIINDLYLEHLEEGAHASFWDATTLGDVKTVAPGQAYLE